MNNILFDMIERYGNWSGQGSPYVVAINKASISVDIYNLPLATYGTIQKFSDTYVNNGNDVFEQKPNAYEFTVCNCYMKAPAFVNSSIGGIYYASRVLYRNCVFGSIKIYIGNVTFDNCMWIGDALT